MKEVSHVLIKYIGLLLYRYLLKQKIAHPHFGGWAIYFDYF